MKKYTKEQLRKLEDLMLDIGRDNLEQSVAYNHLEVLEFLRKEMVLHLSTTEFLAKDGATNINWVVGGKVLAVVGEDDKLHLGDDFIIEREVGAYIINKKYEDIVDSYTEGMELFMEYFLPCTSYDKHNKEFNHKFENGIKPSNSDIEEAEIVQPTVSTTVNTNEEFEKIQKDYADYLREQVVQHKMTLEDMRRKLQDYINDEYPKVKEIFENTQSIVKAREDHKNYVDPIRNKVSEETPEEKKEVQKEIINEVMAGEGEPVIAKTLDFYDDNKEYEDETEVIHNGEVCVVIYDKGEKAVIPKKFYNPNMRGVLDAMPKGSISITTLLGKSASKIGVTLDNVPDYLKEDVAKARDLEIEKAREHSASIEKKDFKNFLGDTKVGGKVKLNLNLGNKAENVTEEKLEEPNTAIATNAAVEEANKFVETQNNKIIKLKLNNNESTNKLNLDKNSLEINTEDETPEDNRVKEKSGKIFLLDREDGQWKLVDDSSIKERWDMIEADQGYLFCDENGVKHADGTDLYYDEEMEYAEAFEAVLEQRNNAPENMINLVKAAEVFTQMMEERKERIQAMK